MQGIPAPIVSALQCEGCHIRVSSHYQQDKELIEAWNKRADNSSCEELK